MCNFLRNIKIFVLLIYYLFSKYLFASSSEISFIVSLQHLIPQSLQVQSINTLTIAPHFSHLTIFPYYHLLKYNQYFFNFLLTFISWTFLLNILYFLLKNYPKATSNIIIITNPIANPIVLIFECSPVCAEGINSSTTT